MEFLIKEGGLNIDELDSNGMTCLMKAAQDKDLKKMQFLLRLGADPDSRY